MADLTQFVQLENNAELGRRQATEEIEAIKEKLQTASDDDRRELQAELDAAQSRLDVLQAGSATLHQLVEWLRASAGRESGDLASTIDDLARTVPEVTSPTAVALQAQSSPSSSRLNPPDSGILTLSSEASALGRKLSVLDDETRRSDRLRQSSDDLRSPLFASIGKRFQASAGNDLQASDVRELQQQKARLDDLAALVKALSQAIVALDKQGVLLATYTSHLKAWRAAVITEDKKTWKALISRLVGAAVLIGALLMIGALVRRATQRHMQETERRHIILVIQRVVLWFTIVVVAVFAFASEFREDLFYRFNVFPIEIPPLRERREDIPLLVNYFVSKFSRRMGRQISSIPKATMEALTNNEWPGNVRELANFIERAVILSRGEELHVPMGELSASYPRTVSEQGATFREAERQAIIAALIAASGRVAGNGGAAERLGLKRTTLQHKIRRLGITEAHYRQ